MSCSSNLLDRVQSDLILLSKLTKNQQITLSTGQLAVQKQYPFGSEWLWRHLVTADDRYKTARYIKNLYDSAIELMDSWFLALCQISDRLDLSKWSVIERQVYAEKIGRLLKYFKLLRESQLGLTNFKLRYDDVDTDSIIHTLASFLERNEYRITELDAVYKILCQGGIYTTTTTTTTTTSLNAPVNIPVNIPVNQQQTSNIHIQKFGNSPPFSMMSASPAIHQIENENSGDHHHTTTDREKDSSATSTISTTTEIGGTAATAEKERHRKR